MLNIVTTYAWTGSGYVAPSAAAKGEKKPGLTNCSCGKKAKLGSLSLAICLMLAIVEGVTSKPSTPPSSSSSNYCQHQ